MKSNPFVRLVFALGMPLLVADIAQGQTVRLPPLTVKVRDFNEDPDGATPAPAGRHPDFNTFGDCNGRNYVNPLIDTTGQRDDTYFPFDNRNPVLSRSLTNCFTGQTEYNQWYNDRDSTINRPFLYDLVFDTVPGQPGIYRYDNQSFFPLDTVLIPGTTRPIPGHPTKSFGQNVTGHKEHNYGFTMEFHAKFTYLAQTPTRAAQKFTFSGDDDVWVFVNGRIAIDLGGVHQRQDSTIVFDAATAARFQMTDGQSYFLDFFFAERHAVLSNCIITTSLALETQKVGTPYPNIAAGPFNSSRNIILATATPDPVKIYYTTDGTDPDSSTGTLFTGAIPITQTTTLKAIAYKAGWNKSDIMTAVYTKAYTPSTMEILDGSGFPLEFGYLTEANTAYTVKVTTTQAGLTSITTPAVTKTALDKETLTLPFKELQGENSIFSGTSPFSISVATANNSKTEASVYDSLTVKWVNPKDPTRDSVERRVLIRPKPVASSAYFSSKQNGSDTVIQFAGTETKIYLIVIDQVLPAGATPMATLVTTPGPGRSVDRDTFPLTVVSPGRYSAEIPVDVNGASVAGDKKLSLAVADQIIGTYKDPIDADVATADAGYGVAPEITPSLQFTDKDGNVLPNGYYFSPVDGLLYLTYRDDWVNGSIPKKTVTLAITNNKGKAGADAETTFTLNLVPGTTGLWKGTFALKDGPAITQYNGTAETYVLGDVIATVPSHNKTGAPQATVSDELLVAYGNENPEITILGPTGNTVINRDDPGVKVVIKDQSLSTARDTLYATLSCTESKDIVANIMLIEKADKPGEYESTLISKSEGAEIKDGILQCQSRDFVKVTYRDPVYDSIKETQVPIDKPVETRISFSSKSDGSDAITAVNDLDADFFYAVIQARSPDVKVADSIKVTFTTSQGENESFWAYETGPYTEKFIAKIPFAFVTGALGAPNQILEGKITAKEINNYVTATGSVTVEGQTVKAPIDLVAGYAPVEKAYIKDTDGDGAGDKVYIVFSKKLSRLPTTVSAQWNDTLTSKSASGDKLGFLNADSTVVVLDFTDKPFEQGKTAVADKQVPKATLPSDPLFKGQKQAIDDSIGPILISAVKHPVNVNGLVSNDPSFNLDTLIVTLSEPLKTADFKNVLKFASSCDDYAHAKTIEAVNNPSASRDNPNEYTVIVDKSAGVTPQTGNCIFLNADPGKYSDVHDNQPPQYGVVLTGFNGANIIQVFRGFPPVAGLDPNHPGFQVAIHDSRDSAKQGYATPVSGTSPSYQVLWVPPAGFSTGDYENDPTPLKDLPSGTRETTIPTTLPVDISAVQVVSTTAYIAHISIYDTYGNFVRRSVQTFGAHGELFNQNRVVPKGSVSFLVWDMKDQHGQTAGQGVYVWKVAFQFKGGKQEVQYTRTGILRNR